MLAEVQTNLQRSIEESSVEITVEELPHVERDGNQLRQLFQNLLENAIQYSGDEPPSVHVSDVSEGGEVLVAVRDDAIGIDSDDQVCIFDMFGRLHSRETHEGTGIGLALCRRIVERHGGDIWLESTPGEGATFFVSLST